jgi:hypothetical protein
VRQHRALGPAGGARRKDDRGNLFGRVVMDRLRCCIRAHGGQRQGPEARIFMDVRAGLLRMDPGVVGITRTINREPGIASFDQDADFAARKPRIAHHRPGVVRGYGVERAQGRETIFHHQHDPVARPHAGPAEHHANRFDPLGKIGIGPSRGPHMDDWCRRGRCRPLQRNIDEPAGEAARISSRSRGNFFPIRPRPRCVGRACAGRASPDHRH